MSVKDKAWVIYALKRETIFYVGRSFNFDRRLREHRSLFGRDFVFEILEEGTCDGYSDAEQKWIVHFLALGCALENKTAGGNGGKWLSAESREKVAAAVRGRPVTWGAKIGAAMKGVPKKWTEEGRCASKRTQFKPGFVPWTKGRSPTAEVRTKISVKVSASLVGNSHRKGIPHSDEVKKRIAESMRRSPNGSPEAMSSKAKKFWNTVTPEARAEFIASREAKRQASLLLRRVAA